MKKVKLYLVGQKYEIEIEDGFFEYIKDDLNKLMSSNNQVKDMLNILLKFSYKSYKTDQKINKIIQKLEIE